MFHDDVDVAAERHSRDAMRLAVWALGSWLVATVIFCVWTTPVQVSQAGDATFSVGKLLICALVGGFFYIVGYAGLAEGGGELTTRRLLIVCAVVPVALLIAGGLLFGKHLQYRRGLDAFDTYTGRFPRSALGDPYVLSDRSSVVVVCARQVRTADTQFCVESITQPKYKHKGDYVIEGSFRFRERDQAGPAGSIDNAFDCSGTPVACPEP
jgi:hypothetical protein